MALVDYSDSDSDANGENHHETTLRAAKKPRLAGNCPPQTTNEPPSPSTLPPLPSTFHDLYASSTRISVKDDPSLHGGRKRVIPHVEGNWPTHIYLEWYPSKSALLILHEIVIQAQRVDVHETSSKVNNSTIHSLLESDLGVQAPLHISLSRPVVLQTEERAGFLETFQDALRDAQIQPFEVSLDRLDWVSNYEKTRWFLVLNVRRPEGDSLNRLLRLSNRTLGLYGQPPLYETSTLAATPRRSSTSKIGATATASGKALSREHQRRRAAKDTEELKDYSDCFHVSIAWSLSEPSTFAQEAISKIDLWKLKELKVRFDCVKAKIGNNVTSIPLLDKYLDDRGFVGD